VIVQEKLAVFYLNTIVDGNDKSQLSRYVIRIPSR